ncbi:hypothetical protein [Nostocoides sp. HKS02]|uniref:hypothetical protein n=1 Tax=Nostocoides sp. HKS02 TaxID=1813880 RepID=UPI0012B4EA19|nr:hypothetical protein [Tetrasphaera sp. HKS02]QGN56695.1 hypothetical protein GKE56_00905 [Tetrasphaera sp. HKS02]
MKRAWLPWRGWWATPLAIYAVTRLVAVLMVLVAAPGRKVRIEGVAGYHTTVVAHRVPSYWEVMTSWDGQWYWGIVRDGYAATALSPAGAPAQTNLAFFPLFPTVVRTLMQLTGGSFPVVATTFNLVVGAAAVVVVYGLVADCVDSRRARVCVLLLCCFVSAPILQAAYTESLALLLVASALWLLHRQHYLWCILPVVLLGLTRNLAPVLVVVVIAHWLNLVRASRTSRARATVPHARLAVLSLASVLAVGLWPALAALHTGEPTAYTTTMRAWPGFTGSLLVPPWVATVVEYPGLGVLVLVALVGLAGALVVLPGRRRWGLELGAWGAVYPLYILATTNPSFSFFRYLLLAFPLGLFWAPDTDSVRQLWRQRVAIGLCVLLGLVAQWFWVDKVLVYAGPHRGWGYP